MTKSVHQEEEGQCGVSTVPRLNELAWRKLSMQAPSISVDSSATIITTDESSDSVESGVQQNNNNCQDFVVIRQDGSLAQFEHDDNASHLTQKPISKLQTFVNFFKGSVGTGLLALPVVFKQAGLVGGLLGTFFIGFLCTYCIHQLLASYRTALKRRGSSTPLDYADVVELTFLNAPQRWLQRLAPIARLITNSFIVAAQLGACSVYLVFCPTVIKQVVDSEAPHFASHLTFFHYQIAIVAILIPYSCVRKLTVLSVFATFANILIIFSLVAIFQYLFQHFQPVDNLPLFTGPIGFVHFFGSALFAIESITLVLPIENRMEDREALGRWNGLLTLTMTIVICLYVAVGFYGYLTYGAASQVLLINLPENALFNTVRILWAISALISFNHIMLAPVCIFWPVLHQFLLSKWHKIAKYDRYILRITLLFVTFAFAAVVPCLEQLIALVGALTMASLGLYIPALLEVVSQLPRSETENAVQEPRQVVTTENNVSVGPVPYARSLSRQESIVRAMKQTKRRLAKPPFWVVAIRGGGIFLLGLSGSIAATYLTIAELVHIIESGKSC